MRATSGFFHDSTGQNHIPCKPAGVKIKIYWGEAVLAGVDPDVGQDLEWKAAEYRYSH